MAASFWRRHRATIAVLLLALVFYAIGYRKGSVIAVLAGVGFEIVFWVRVWRAGPANAVRDEHHR